jgi:beta-glucanase (GH16 family)
MIKKLSYILCFITLSAFAQDTKTLIFEEQFDGTTLNEANWNYELGNGCPNICGWGNNERQIYTKENSSLRDGHLVITASKEDAVYKSTRITTKDKVEFQYGTIEVRAKLPLGHGLWPAIWMLGHDISDIGWPACGEIDIMEYVGRAPHEIHTTPVIKNDKTWPFNKPFFIILNLAIGGNFGGPDVDDSIFPQEFIIDYVKVFK